MNLKSIASAALTGVFSLPLFAQTLTKPNIVVILADDMGFSDLGCFGSEIITPNLDALANNGLRFTNFYNCGRCCPTRASLLTGVYPHQAGMGHMAGGVKSIPSNDAYQGYLNNLVVTLGDVMKSAGYFTAIAGKWHVGDMVDTMKPNARGFDRSYEGQGFYALEDAGGNNVVELNSVPIANGGDTSPADWYSSYKWAEWGTKFINEGIALQKPFFLYLAFNAPHFPIQAPDSVVNKYIGKYSSGWSALRQTRYAKQKAIGLIDDKFILTPDDPDFTPWSSLSALEKLQQDSIMATYAACVDILDQSVGRLIDSLKAKGVFENTVIFFMSDNGGNAEGQSNGLGNNANPGAKIGSSMSNIHCGGTWANAQNTPFREYKHYIHEGGIHTSFIAHWPNGIASKGEFRSQTGHVMDIMATCLDITGAQYPTMINGNQIIPFQGTSLVPAFTNNPIVRDTLAWEHEANRGIRIGNMKCVAKVVKYGVFTQADHNKWELYDMATDPTEMNNLATQNPTLLNNMIDDWEKWAIKKKVFEWPWGTYYDNKVNISSDMVYYFPFDGNYLDQTNQMAIQPTNSPLFSIGKYGQAVEMNGTNQYLDVTSTEFNNIDISKTQFTACAWVYNDSKSTSARNTLISQSYGVGIGRSIIERTKKTGGIALSTFIGGTRHTSTTLNFKDNEWVHLAIVGNNTNHTITFYINGEQDGAVLTTNVFESVDGNHRIGAQNTGTKEFWSGKIDEFYFFKKALTKQEIGKVMNNQWFNASIVNENNYQNLKVFPNPTDNDFFISSENACQKVEIFDLSGRPCMTFENTNHIQIENLKTGLYLVKIHTEGNPVQILKISVH
ncbi:MAG: sulfatase-like hydrolase/transferase [Bacteroidia bacterium]|nr:sulfatase-like hydrolase/transferase [Bacteroidia bacterium]